MKKLEKCLFCQQSLDNSKEHIIPKSINGRLTSRDIICSKCNSFFGRYLDPVYKEFLNPLLLIFGLENAQAVQFENGEKEKYIVDKNMAVRPVKPTQLFVRTEKGIRYEIEGTPKQVKSAVSSLNKKLAPYNIRLTTSEVAQYFTSYNDDLKMPFLLDIDCNGLFVDHFRTEPITFYVRNGYI